VNCKPRLKHREAHLHAETDTTCHQRPTVLIEVDFSLPFEQQVSREARIRQTCIGESERYHHPPPQQMAVKFPGNDQRFKNVPHSVF